MATLSLIAEPFPDWEAAAHFAAAADLAVAIADTAPRSCGARFLTARGTEAPEFSSPKITVEQLPMRASALPLIWQSHATARPLDGEMTHAITPMMPLRPHAEDDGTQTSVTVPHALAWESPELLTASQGRLTRAFVKRAARHADVIVTTSHATAAVLQQHYGSTLPVQVIPPVAPSSFLAAADSHERRAALGLPERYLVTTANDDELGRLSWVFDALQSDPSLPHLVVITGLDPVQQAKGQAHSGELADRIPDALRGRVILVSSADLADVGATISGAEMLVQPQAFAATGYAVVAALMAAIPVLHAGTDAVTEHVLDAGIVESDPVGFATALSRLFIPSAGDGSSEFELLAVHAADRGRSFSWRAVAWQLWETHASI